MALLNTAFNSLSITGTTATLNCTPPIDINYDHTQIIYRLFGSSSFTIGATFIGTQGVAEDQTQTGLISGRIYEFAVLSCDSNGLYAIIDETRKAQNTALISENNLFVENAKTLLANCTEFQTYTNTSNASEALLRIFTREYNLITEVKNFPVATIYFEGSTNSERIDTDNFISNANISIRFTESCSSEHDRDDSALSIAHLDTIEKIAMEIKQLQGVDSFLLVKSITMVEAPMFMNLTDSIEEMSADYIYSTYLIETGV